MSYSIRQNICKNTVYNDTINCNSNGGVIVRNEINLQDRMLAALRQQGQNTTFFLMNGFQMRGIIRGFDNFVVILESEGKQQMIYKHPAEQDGQRDRVEPQTVAVRADLFFFTFSL